VSGDSTGPNVNIKVPKKTYYSYKEREHFNEKLKVKQKTEVRLSE
jgi:hypothetical protein